MIEKRKISMNELFERIERQKFETTKPDFKIPSFKISKNFLTIGIILFSFLIFALASGVVSAEIKGAINTTEGAKPFYTIDANPQNCTLSASQSCSLTWQVNATGALNTAFEFYGITDANTTNVINVNSAKINITISAKINITIAEMTITETLNPSRVAVNENVSVYGYLNLSNNDTANNNNVSVYADDVFLGTTATNGNGFYNYTFNLSTGGVKTIKIN